MQGKLGNLKLELGKMGGLHDGMKAVHEALARAGIDQNKIQVEVRNELEQAHKAFADAMHAYTNSRHSYDSSNKVLEDLARHGVTISKGATVTVRNRGNSVKTVVKSDDTGTYVLVADPKKRLTAHDKNGKLVFDGEIETPDQQSKLPDGLWEKVKPLVEGIEPGQNKEPEAEVDDPASGAPERRAGDRE